MKSLILFICLCVFCVNSYSQSFSGVYIGSDLNKTILEFKQKGFKFKEYMDNGAVMIGSISSYSSVELFLFSSPKTKKVSRVVIYLPEETNWYSISSTFNKFVDLFTQKYGQPSYTFKNFVSPYYEGDGYEMSAIGLEKCEYAGLWLDNKNANYFVEISKYKQVRLIYENVSLTNLLIEETKKIESNSF